MEQNTSEHIAASNFYHFLLLIIAIETFNEITWRLANAIPSKGYSWTGQSAVRDQLCWWFFQSISEKCGDAFTDGRPAGLVTGQFVQPSAWWSEFWSDVFRFAIAEDGWFEKTLSVLATCTHVYDQQMRVICVLANPERFRIVGFLWWILGLLSAAYRSSGRARCGLIKDGIVIIFVCCGWANQSQNKMKNCIISQLLYTRQLSVKCNYYFLYKHNLFVFN